jgi:nucleotidyltransferase substrate binding protein (TIGR01987 family)
MEQDIRWQQRFSNYRKALEKLIEAVDLLKDDISHHEIEDERQIVDEMLKEGLIQRFEYTYELAWNVMKDYAEYQGNNTITGSRDATREAFKMGLIDSSEDWMAMLASRKLTTHTYNEATANQIYKEVMEVYYPLFLDFENKMESLL